MASGLDLTRGRRDVFAWDGDRKRRRSAGFESLSELKPEVVLHLIINLDLGVKF